MQLAELQEMNATLDPPRPTIVCLCGSTKFWREFQKASLHETLAGKIVLSIGAASGTDDDHFGNLPKETYDRVKSMLDELHLRKIDLADEILVLNVGGYIGQSTAKEIVYAEAQGKTIRLLEPWLLDSSRALLNSKLTSKLKGPMLILDPPRWPGGPAICPIENLPAFPTEADAFKFQRHGSREAPRTRILRLWKCDCCDHWHFTATTPSPSGASSGTERR